MAVLATLDDLRAAVVRRLESLPVLTGVAVIPEDRQNIATEVRKAMANGKGLAIVIYTGDAKNIAPAAPIPQCELELIVEVGEIPAMNRGPAGTKIPGCEVARYCVRGLHQHEWSYGKSLTFQQQQFNKDDKAMIVQHLLFFTTIVSFDAEIGVK